MAKYLDNAGVTHLVKKLKSDVIPNVKVNAAKKADTVPASGIDGVIDISHIPQGALERVVTVADDTARYKLTTQQVQLGDTVKVTATGRMYIVVDESKLTAAAGYMEYAAGTAASVPWSGVTGKPSSFTPSDHTHSGDLKIGATTKSYTTDSGQVWTKQDILGASPTVSGSGNAVTGMSVSGDTITLTKGTTFALKSAQDALGGRVADLEAFTGAGDGSGLSDKLNAAGYGIVLFAGFLSVTPAIQQTSLSTAPALAIRKSSTATDGTITIAAIYAKDTAGKYYQNWGDSQKATPDADSKAKLHTHKLYIDTTTGKAYYAPTDTTLKEVDGGDTALSDTEIDNAINAA